jgi:hypothetical protein
MKIYKVNAASSIEALAAREPLFALKLCGTFTNRELKSLIDSSHGRCFALYLSNEMAAVPDRFLSNIALPEYIVIPEGVVSLGKMELLPSVHLRQLCLPSTLRSIDATLFPFSQIERIRFPNGTNYFAYDGGRILSKRDGAFICQDSQYVAPEELFQQAAHEPLAKGNQERLRGMRKAASNALK